MHTATASLSRLQVESFFDEASSTFSHLVLDRETGQCALVDSVLDYDPKSGRTRTTGAERLVARVRELGAQVQWLLETHVHADHLSAAPWLPSRAKPGSALNSVPKVFCTVVICAPRRCTRPATRRRA